jgi:hypothetical protein
MDWRAAQIGLDIAQNAPAAQRRRAALQRLETLEPGPFPPQRLGPYLLPSPKPFTAFQRVVAAAGPLSAAPLFGAEPERPKQVALRAHDQWNAPAVRKSEPRFERQPPGKASFADAHRRLVLLFIPPHDSGEGGPRVARWEGRLTRSFVAVARK